MKTTISEFRPPRGGALIAASALTWGLLANCFAVDFDDGGIHTINDGSLINETIAVSNGTTLKIAPGAIIEGTIQVFDTSSLNISGGLFGPTSLYGRTYLYDSSTTVITGGTFGGTGLTSGTGGIYTFNDASLTIHGGSFGTTGTSNGSGLINPSGSSVVEIHGGTFGGPGSLTGSIQARGGTTNIRGGTFGVGAGTGNGIFSMSQDSVINILGGSLIPRTDGTSHVNVHSPDALVTFSGCGFTEPDGTPLPFGLLPNINAFRFLVTSPSQGTYQARVYAFYPNAVRLDYVPCNEDPVADAGPDQTVECTGLLTSIQLDGTSSSDPEGDALGYEWSVPDGASLDDPFSAAPTGDFPHGPTLVTLTVTDGNGGISTDDVLVVVEDTTAPVVICTTDLIALHPPNHRVEPVTIYVDVTEECSDVTLTCWVSSSEPDDANGDGSHTGDVDGEDGYTLRVPVDLEYDAALAAFVGDVDLRAERDGSATGRTYSIECEVGDMSGNVATASCVVVVPHDRRKVK